MVITFIKPNQMHIEKKKFICIEPPAIAKLNALTPKDIERRFFDERLEYINYELPTDLAVISINTFTALKGYRIAQKYRERGVKVVIGGMHATLCPDEAMKYADCVIVGEAENFFSQVIEDFKKGELKDKYQGCARCNMVGVTPDRSIFKGKRYAPIQHVETSRGCYHNCNFCALAAIYKQKVTYRPVDEVIEEIKNLKTKVIYITDDNVSSNLEYRKELYTKMIPLKKIWMGEINIEALFNEEFVKLMKRSGCLNLFVGFESTSIVTLEKMGKKSNSRVEEYGRVIDNCVRNKITVSAGAVVGYEGDTKENAQKVFDFINSHQLFVSTISNLFPYPGTPIYEELKGKGLLLDKEWWLEEKNPFTRGLYKSNTFTPEELSKLGYGYFTGYLSYKNIFKRLIKSKYPLDVKLLTLLANIFFKHNIWLLE
ncbi:MAG: B12-binding domain-containing radical SAM protein [Candidatus Omnitrophica bacterium]|nr:B12-binding domain-containing radical SAM protein [Candidatus Omnitrophota bacterium]